MAVYGESRYGTELYGFNRPTQYVTGGAPLPANFSSYLLDPFTAAAIDYEHIQVSWASPAVGTSTPMTEFRLLVSRYGFPVDENDGNIVVDTTDVTTLGTFYIDDAVVGGQMYYYGMYINTGTMWLRAGFAAALMPTNYGSGTTLFGLLPQYFRDLQDYALTDTPSPSYVTAPPVPASGAVLGNPYAFPVLVSLSGGTVVNAVADDVPNQVSPFWVAGNGTVQIFYDFEPWVSGNGYTAGQGASYEGANYVAVNDIPVSWKTPNADTDNWKSSAPVAPTWQWQNIPDGGTDAYLEQYLNVIGWGLDYLKTQYDFEFQNLNNPMTMALDDLYALCLEMGIPFQTEVPAYYMRKAAQNWTVVMQNRGSMSGIAEHISLLTGYGADIQLTKNFMLEADNSAPLNPVYPDWNPNQIMSGGSYFTYPVYPDWVETQEYVTGNVVNYNGIYYSCIQECTGIAPGITYHWDTYWESAPGPYVWKANVTIYPDPAYTTWSGSAVYPYGSFVMYDSLYYFCEVAIDPATWSDTSAYAVNTIVRYGSAFYKCSTAVTAPTGGTTNTVPSSDTTHWAAYTYPAPPSDTTHWYAGNGAHFDVVPPYSLWNANEAYNVGSVVEFANQYYQATTAVAYSSTGNATPAADTTHWEVAPWAPTGANNDWTLIVGQYSLPSTLAISGLKGGVNTWEALLPQQAVSYNPSTNPLSEGNGFVNPTNTVAWNQHTFRVTNGVSSAQNVWLRSLSRATTDVPSTNSNYAPDPDVVVQHGTPVPYTAEDYDEYDPTVRYATNSLVMYNGLNYIALRASTGATPPLYGTPLNSNTDFETGITGWSAVNGTIAQSSAQHFHGQYSLALTPNGTSTQAYATTAAIPVTPGATYRSSAWVYATAAITSAVSPSINWYDAFGKYISNSNDNVSVAATTWTYVSVVATAPANATSAMVTLNVAGTPAASNITYWDLAELTTISTPEWALVGRDSRVPVMLSGYVAGDQTAATPGAAITGGVSTAVTPFVEFYDDWGNFLSRTFARTGPSNYAYASFDTYIGTFLNGLPDDTDNVQWVSEQGSWDIDGNGAAYPSIPGQESIAVVPVQSSASQAITFAGTPIEGQDIGLVFWYENNSNYWLAGMTGLWACVSGGVVSEASNMFAYAEPFQVGDRMYVITNQSASAITLPDGSALAATSIAIYKNGLAASDKVGSAAAPSGTYVPSGTTSYSGLGSVNIIGTNDITDPGFESNATTGWTASNSAALTATTSYARSGTYSMSVPAESASYTLSYTAQSAIVNYNYVGSAWVSTGAAATTSAKVNVELVFSNSGTVLKTITGFKSVTPKSTWQELYAYGVAPANANEVQLVITVTGSAPELYIDDTFLGTAGAGS